MIAQAFNLLVDLLNWFWRVSPITLRLIRVDLPNEVEVLVTNLVDSKCYSARLFKGLYHLR